ncbi:hypothetical protein T4B_13642 [Trichinella pseudospiralis]|uniref:Uncharacterized protein n=1 Tax=Trichinella pseudospiralis TaxID=6337 RepID=A0A0V1GKC1_TRIPS|nr:hypothetical protein T4B_13642 [Trichinella pseudospiralis]
MNRSGLGLNTTSKTETQPHHAKTTKTITVIHRRPLFIVKLVYFHDPARRTRVLRAKPTLSFACDLSGLYPFSY